jgi:hypothetical protein
MEFAKTVVRSPYFLAFGIAAGAWAGLEFMQPGALYDANGHAEYLGAHTIALIVLIATLGVMQYRGTISLPMPAFLKGKSRSMMMMPPPEMMSVPAAPLAGGAAPMMAVTTSMKDLLTPDQW